MTSLNFRKGNWVEFSVKSEGKHSSECKNNAVLLFIRFTITVNNSSHRKLIE